ncbi:DUF2935 domain-containing protein [Rossellomorea aquimaris]|uniref:DUF2935 domain-containing protein n=1 Tax=Rossellomorea aquimaris TaxID=189382 RepID=UPI001CD6A8C6|nr:DUF2935 domain-containing protein [Rossellomorea aquimaris]MCA1058219.1 DUF2935 domain-containing protein [Rossellomorea aquimaris]
MGFENITPWQEHEFWLGILKDHAYFIRDYLSPTEVKWVTQAEYYIEWFENVEKEMMKIPRDLPVSAPEMIQLSEWAQEVSYQYYTFEGHLLHLRLYNQVNLNLSPSYLNGTLAENREYLRILQSYTRGEEYPLLPLVDLMDLWLDDQRGHAALLVDILDSAEIDLIEKGNALMVQFSQFMVKNDMFKGYLHFTQPGFPAQIRFAEDVSIQVVAFTQLVEEVLNLYVNDEVLNNSTLRFLEHHFPEACYFMKKLSYYAPAIHYPDCKLTKPTLRKDNKA